MVSIYPTQFPIVSAGIILVNKGNYNLAKKNSLGLWSFPENNVPPGIYPKITAQFSLYEQTGVYVDLSVLDEVPKYYFLSGTVLMYLVDVELFRSRITLPQFTPPPNDYVMTGWYSEHNVVYMLTSSSCDYCTKKWFYI